MLVKLASLSKAEIIEYFCRMFLFVLNNELWNDHKGRLAYIAFMLKIWQKLGKINVKMSKGDNFTIMSFVWSSAVQSVRIKRLNFSEYSGQKLSGNIKTYVCWIL